MIFTYKAFTREGEEPQGTAEALGVEWAISQLQKRGLVISEIHAPNEKRLKISFLSLFNRVSNKDIVILSRQMATLFSAQISALRIFRLLASQVENSTLKKYLTEISDDLSGG